MLKYIASIYKNSSNSVYLCSICYLNGLYIGICGFSHGACGPRARHGRLLVLFAFSSCPSIADQHLPSRI